MEMGTKIYLLYISFYDQHAAFYDRKKKPPELPPEPKRISLGPRVQNRLYAIGEKENEITDLPDLDLDLSFPDSSFCVAKSRLFFVGGHVDGTSEEAKINGILSLKLATDMDPTWGEIPILYEGEYWFSGGAAVSGVLIYAIEWEGAIYVFDPKIMSVKLYHPANNLLRGFRHFLVAFNDKKMYVHCAELSSRTSVFGYYDIPSLDWHVIHLRTTCLFAYRHPTVVIRDKYLIYFETFCPLDYTDPFVNYWEKFRPGLYVYDILRDKWLDEPVKNLTNDGIVFPSDCPDESSVMQVSADELAFVWGTVNLDKTSEFHVTRFRLDVYDDAGPPPTFKAENVRDQHFHVAIPIYQVKFPASASSYHRMASLSLLNLLSIIMHLGIMLWRLK